jgi:hypothetical protein
VVPRLPTAPAADRPALSLNRAAFLVGLVCLGVATALNAVLLHETGLSGDEPYYARIAAHPAGPHNFPYAFRLSIPYLVHVLPFSQAFSWELLALLCVAVAAGALFVLLCEFEVDARLAAGLAVCFAISPPVLVVLLHAGARGQAQPGLDRATGSWIGLLVGLAGTFRRGLLACLAARGQKGLQATRGTVRRARQ